MCTKSRGSAGPPPGPARPASRDTSSIECRDRDSEELPDALKLGRAEMLAAAKELGPDWLGEPGAAGKLLLLLLPPTPMLDDDVPGPAGLVPVVLDPMPESDVDPWV